MNNELSELEQELLKKDKTISALSKYVERLSQHKEGVMSKIQTALLLENKLKMQHSALQSAESLARKNQRKLDTERDFIRATMNSLNECVIVTQLDGLITYANPAALSLLDYGKEKLPQQHINTVLALTTDEIIPINLIPSESKELGSKQISFLNVQEESITIEWSSAIIKNQQDQQQGYVFTFNDITEEHKLRTELKHQAAHDALTGLLNRHEFDTRLSNCLASEHKKNVRHSLIYIDLDQFKVVNDTCGHQAGDQLLMQLAYIIAKKVRKRDTLARLGGDEFGVLLEVCPKKMAQKIAYELLNTIQEFRFTWEDKVFTLGASIGIAHFSSGTQMSNDPLSAADASCYQAKEDGRNRIQETDISNIQQPLYIPHADMQWVSRINTALESNQFKLYQQKIVPTNPGANELLHYEVLLRLQGENNEIINPGSFLPPAERYGLINRVDQWVITNTLKWLSENPQVLEQTKLCSINLSGLSLSDKNFSVFVKHQFLKFNINCQKICFEITESSAILNLALAMEFMTDMHALGCSFSLDDFGTGMSSFSYLKQLPVNHLKIDGSFIRDIHNDPIDLFMTRSINEIGHVMGMSTIAEFVENEEIFQMLKQLGIDYAQGYHIAKPAPLDELIQQIN